MVYKRATAQLRAAGIQYVVIEKRLWGASPHDPRMPRQRSQCFPTWQDAVQAVLEGFRPQAIQEENTPCRPPT